MACRKYILLSIRATNTHVHLALAQALIAIPYFLPVRPITTLFLLYLKYILDLVHAGMQDDNVLQYSTNVAGLIEGSGIP